MLGRHERRQLRKDHARHRGQVALALQHAGEARRLVFSQSCSVFWRVVSRRLRIISLSLSFSTATSPLASHPDLPRQIALGHRCRDVGDGPHLVGEVGRKLVDVVGEVLPHAGDLRGLGLAAELALDPDLAGDAGHLGREPVELIDHRVDRVLQLEELALDVGGDLLAQVAVGHRRGHLGDVAHLSGEVARHQVDVVGQVLPDAADLDRDGCRLAKLALGSDLAGHAGHLRDETVELVHHRVDGVLQLEHLPVDVRGDLLAQVPARDRADDALHLNRRAHEVIDEAVDRLDALRPHAVRSPQRDPMGKLALFADDAADLCQFGPQHLVRGDHVVEPVRDLARYACPVERHANAEVAVLDIRQHPQQHRLVDGDAGLQIPRQCDLGRSVLRACHSRRPTPRTLPQARNDSRYQLHQISPLTARRPLAGKNAARRVRGTNSLTAPGIATMPVDSLYRKPGVRLRIPFAFPRRARPVASA